MVCYKQYDKCKFPQKRKHPALRSAHECLAENHDMLMGSILQCLQVKGRLLCAKGKKDPQGREMH